jgi:hypothetical protein
MDPGPHGSALIIVGWIRIQMGKNDHQRKQTKEEMYCFEVIGCSLLRAEGQFMINIKHDILKKP